MFYLKTEKLEDGSEVSNLNASNGEELVEIWAAPSYKAGWCAERILTLALERFKNCGSDAEAVRFMDALDDCITNFK